MRFIYASNCIGTQCKVLLKQVVVQASARMALGQAAVRPWVFSRFKQTQGRFYGNSKEEIPSCKGVWKNIAGPHIRVFPLLLPKQHMPRYWDGTGPTPMTFKFRCQKSQLMWNKLFISKTHGVALIRVPPGTFQGYLHMCLRLTGKRFFPFNINFKKLFKNCTWAYYSRELWTHPNARHVW